MRIRARRGQAMMEMVVGVFALALVVSALMLFAKYITTNLAVQNSARNPGVDANGAQNGDSVAVDDFAQRWFVGKGSLKIDEKVEMPETVILDP